MLPRHLVKSKWRIDLKSLLLQYYEDATSLKISGNLLIPKRDDEWRLNWTKSNWILNDLCSGDETDSNDHSYNSD